MKNIILFISLLIYSLALTQQNNHPDYFEKYWTPSAGFVTNDYYVFQCSALIATDSTYIGAGNIGLAGGWDQKSYAFCINEEWKGYVWDHITEGYNNSGIMWYYSLISTLDGNYLTVTDQGEPGINDDPANFQLAISKYAPNGNIIFRKKYFDSNQNEIQIFDVKELKDSSILLS